MSTHSRILAKMILIVLVFFILLYITYKHYTWSFNPGFYICFFLTSGSQKVIRLGNADRENSGVNNGKDPSNVRSWSIKAKDKNNSLVETTSSAGMGAPPGKPALPPPGLPPPPPPRPPALAPRPPPPPRAAHPPPAPPKPMKGRTQLAPLRPKEGNSSEGGESDAPKPKLKPFFWDKVAAKPDQSMVWHEISAGSFQ